MRTSVFSLIVLALLAVTGPAQACFGITCDDRLFGKQRKQEYQKTMEVQVTARVHASVVRQEVKAVQTTWVSPRPFISKSVAPAVDHVNYVETSSGGCACVVSDSMYPATLKQGGRTAGGDRFERYTSEKMEYRSLAINGQPGGFIGTACSDKLSSYDQVTLCRPGKGEYGGSHVVDGAKLSRWQSEGLTAFKDCLCIGDDSFCRKLGFKDHN